MSSFKITNTRQSFSSFFVSSPTGAWIMIFIYSIAFAMVAMVNQPEAHKIIIKVTQSIFLLVYLSVVFSEFLGSGNPKSIFRRLIPVFFLVNLTIGLSIFLSGAIWSV